MPPNCQFEIDDAEDEWVWRHKFDYVHGRYIVPFLNNLPKLMDNIYDNLNPGGYVEFLEAAMLFQAVDNTLDGKPMKVWNQLMIEGELWFPGRFSWESPPPPLSAKKPFIPPLGRVLRCLVVPSRGRASF